MRPFLILILATLLAFMPHHAGSQVVAGTHTPSDSVRYQPRPLVSAQLPVSLTLITSGALTHAWQPMTDINHHFRDNMQQWRQDHLDNRRFYFDNYIQYLPVATVVVLKLAGVESQRPLLHLATSLAGSYLTMGAIVITSKSIFDLQRPDGRGHNTFPSGHTATAFTGAEALRLEYGHQHPWIAVAAYAVATTTGFMRTYNNRHWLGDVIAGAGIGILSANFSFWLTDRIYSRRHSSLPATSYLTPSYILQ